jgi:drug/metabolite transporter (DMT)-like permease
MFDDVPGEIIALITTLCWSIGIFPFTEASRRIGPAAVNKYRLLMALVIISLVLIIFFGKSFTELFSAPTQKQYLYLMLSGVIGFTLGDYLGFSSFVKLGPRLASIYTTLGPGFALIFGFAFLEETMNFIGFIGIGVTIAGVIWLTQSKKEKVQAIEKGFKPDKVGIIFGIGSALCQGLGITLSKMGLLENTATNHLVEVHANWVRLLGGFGLAFIISVFTGNFFRYAKPVFRNEKNGVFFMLLGTIFGPVLGVSFSLITISKINVAVAQTIFALLPVFVLPLNYIIYKEKITFTSILACLVSIAGVMLLIWRDSIFALITRN